MGATHSKDSRENVDREMAAIICRSIATVSL